MTPALQKMVEAMAAEMQLQHREVQGSIRVGVLARRSPGRYLVDAEIDLEKVARAGLEALAALDGVVTGLAGQAVFDRAVAEILKETL